MGSELCFRVQVCGTFTWKWPGVTGCLKLHVLRDWLLYTVMERWERVIMMTETFCHFPHQGTVGNAWKHFSVPQRWAYRIVGKATHATKHCFMHETVLPGEVLSCLECLSAVQRPANPESGIAGAHRSVLLVQHGLV